MVKSKTHLFPNMSKWLRVQMLSIPFSKNSGRLKWRVDRRLSCVYLSIFLDSPTCDEFHRSKLTAY